MKKPLIGSVQSTLVTILERRVAMRLMWTTIRLPVAGAAAFEIARADTEIGFVRAKACQHARQQPLIV